MGKKICLRCSIRVIVARFLSLAGKRKYHLAPTLKYYLQMIDRPGEQFATQLPKMLPVILPLSAPDVDTRSRARTAWSATIVWMSTGFRLMTSMVPTNAVIAVVGLLAPVALRCFDVTFLKARRKKKARFAECNFYASGVRVQGMWNAGSTLARCGLVKPRRRAARTPRERACKYAENCRRILCAVRGAGT